MTHKWTSLIFSLGQKWLDVVFNVKLKLTFLTEAFTPLEVLSEIKFYKVLMCLWAIIKSANCHIETETEFGGNVNLAEAVARVFDGHDEAGVAVNLIRNFLNRLPTSDPAKAQ